MNDIESLFSQYQQKGVLVDTNILLLYFVGMTNRERIARFNRTQNFLPDDYDTLVRILSYFSKIITTPNILTEVNSLANQLGEPERTQCFTIFAQGISIFKECYLESKAVASDQNFPRFGLTDCSILSFARNQYLVLTDDLKLANHLQEQGIDTVNFNNIRIYGWK
ncbi:PIN domain-containing protein [Leptolyngbyaceae cyanobacterium UHCC 1019]